MGAAGYAARSCCRAALQFHGRSLSSRSCGVSAVRARTAASQAWGSTLLSVAVPMSVYMAAARTPPRSEPANSRPCPSSVPHLRRNPVRRNRFLRSSVGHALGAAGTDVTGARRVCYIRGRGPGRLPVKADALGVHRRPNTRSSRRVSPWPTTTAVMPRPIFRARSVPRRPPAGSRR